MRHCHAPSPASDGTSGCVMDRPLQRSSWRRRAVLAAGLLGLGAVFSIVRSAASALSGDPSSAAERGRLHAICHPRPPLRGPPDAPAAPPRQVDSARVSLGRADLLRQEPFGAAGTSCASCHDPAQGFAGNNGSRLGVALGSRPDHFAKRNTPSVLYLRFRPQVSSSLGGGRAARRCLRRILLGRTDRLDRRAREAAADEPRRDEQR